MSGFGVVCLHCSGTAFSRPRVGRYSTTVPVLTGCVRFTWRDSWQHDTTCPNMNTYPEGWLFAIRAICKLVRDSQDGIVGVWPYNAFVDMVWGIFSFEDDSWPDTTFQLWRCVGLNISVYIVLLLMLVVMANTFPRIMNFYYAHFAILESVRKLEPREVVLEDSARFEQRMPSTSSAFKVVLD